ncbi:MAG: hypothetical protein RBR88_06840 [Candidatus Saccharicenans sp.]|nr:hypothetical protein [Candidatus Saccharicenans sp.]
MNNNLLFVICQFNSAKKMLATYQKIIMETICEAIRDVIPGIKARCDYCHSERIVFYTEAMSEEAPEKITVTIVNQKDRDFWLSSVITDVFPALGGSVDDVSICLSQEERDEIIKRLKKLRDGKETNNGAF